MRSEDIIKVENLGRKNDFIIRWNMTYLCNYKCDFCIQGNRESHSLKSRNESKEKRRKICDNLIKFIETKLNKKYDHINIYLIGGEVTILSDFIEIITKLVNCKFNGKITFWITTNLSTSKKVLDELAKIFNNQDIYERELRLNASYYKEYANEDEFIDKIKTLNKINKYINIINFRYLYKKIWKILKKYNKSRTITNIRRKFGKINATIGYPICNDQDYKEYLEFKKKYKKITTDIHFIVIKGYKTSISEKLKKKILKNNDMYKNIKVTFKNGEKYYCSNNNKISLKLDGEEGFNSKGYLCDIGINDMTIDNLGEVSRCTSCKSETIIGSMLSNKFTLPVNKLICPANRCNCSYYQLIEKLENNNR